MSTLVFTIIGDDRTGLVEEIAQIINDHEASWLGSRMSHLGGKFAGMVEVEGDSARLSSLKDALEGLKSSGLSVIAEESSSGAAAEPATLSVTMLGLDRPGIVREVSHALAERKLNVVDLQTDISQAAMTGKPMFNGTAVVAVNDTVDLDELADRLDEISKELGVDIELSDD